MCVTVLRGCPLHPPSHPGKQVCGWHSGVCVWGRCAHGLPEDVPALCSDDARSSLPQTCGKGECTCGNNSLRPCWRSARQKAALAACLPQSLSSWRVSGVRVKEGCCSHLGSMCVGSGWSPRYGLGQQWQGCVMSHVHGKACAGRAQARAENLAQDRSGQLVLCVKGVGARC